MHKLQLLSLTTLLLLSVGCGEQFPSNGVFIVQTVKSYGDSIYEYMLVSTNTNQNNFYLKDSANKYIVGDTVHLTKQITNRSRERERFEVCY